MSRKGSVHLPGQPTKRNERISSHEFSASAAKDASVETGVREYHGTAQLSPQWRGAIAAQVLGRRIVR